ncbi:MAG: heavy-metal-associated domain-containing protein [Burkholderiaceae bacterium]|nr:MAG: heavy-metal-associated domain-containing protein [Burkholderiaceae bacterium]
MIEFKVTDMTCGHCASTIAKALRFVDAQAKVEINIAQRHVTIEPGEADAGEFAEAIKDAGYTPERIQTSSPQPHHGANERTSCCGGCGQL